MRPNVVVRIGAAHDEVVIDGHTFDRSGLDRKQRNAMAALIIESLGFKPPKPRRFRAHRNTNVQAHNVQAHNVQMHNGARHGRK